MVNLALMDKVLDVNKEAKTVRVQAGIRVSQLVDALKEHGLTLQNFASIREQQIGGIIQVIDFYLFFITLMKTMDQLYCSVLLGSYVLGPFLNLWLAVIFQ